MMKKLICWLLIMMILCAGSALAASEPRYLLPGGWGYTDDGKVYDPDGNIYDSIWDPWCISLLSAGTHWGYGDREFMDANWLLRYDNTIPSDPSWRAGERDNTLIYEEQRYLLPGSWGYTDDGKIYDPHGNVYDSIWDHDCMFNLGMINWGYNDMSFMIENLLLDDDGVPANPDWVATDNGIAEITNRIEIPKTGDASANPAVLYAAVILAACGLFLASRKRRA